ncbi:MAG: pyridoxal 5'-phosphate synthase glutaminase subunit PdxT [Deltaproteobacteria bacterium]|nr:pyridoxal 5'-phosphate synthase glutaminase subunit PdxT [Deltaproteobacteria bacterium]
MARRIGVLALQGDFAKHAAMLTRLGATALEIRRERQLAGCDALILPGGESTTLTKLLDSYGFYEPIRDFARRRPVMGTCAGAILAAREVDDPRVRPLNLIDISARRNAYGRQVDSFIAEVAAPCLPPPPRFRAIFIRAPQIVRAGPETEVLIFLGPDPVMVRQENILALTFHPELTEDFRIHEYFLAMTRG